MSNLDRIRETLDAIDSTVRILTDENELLRRDLASSTNRECAAIRRIRDLESREAEAEPVAWCVSASFYHALFHVQEEAEKKAAYFRTKPIPLYRLRKSPAPTVTPAAPTTPPADGTSPSHSIQVPGGDPICVPDAYAPERNVLVIPGCWTISLAARKALDIASLTQFPTQFDFNGIRILASETDTVDSIEDLYHSKTKHRNRA